MTTYPRAGTLPRDVRPLWHPGTGPYFREVSMPDTKPGYGASAELNRYWTKGPGLARWASSPTPYRTLLALLIAAGVPENQAHGLAAEYFHAVFGRWPGKGR